MDKTGLAGIACAWELDISIVKAHIARRYSQNGLGVNGGILRFTYWRLERWKSNDDYPAYPKLCNFFPVTQVPDVELTISYLNLLQAFVADRLKHIKTVHQASSQLLNIG